MPAPSRKRVLSRQTKLTSQQRQQLLISSQQKRPCVTPPLGSPENHSYSSTCVGSRVSLRDGPSGYLIEKSYINAYLKSQCTKNSVAHIFKTLFSNICITFLKFSQPALTIKTVKRFFFTAAFGTFDKPAC